MLSAWRVRAGEMAKQIAAGDELEPKLALLLELVMLEAAIDAATMVSITADPPAAARDLGLVMLGRVAQLSVERSGG
jgi:hypothetical protein